jgi:hypothetical protein
MSRPVQDKLSHSLNLLVWNRMQRELSTLINKTIVHRMTFANRGRSIAALMAERSGS